MHLREGMGYSMKGKKHTAAFFSYLIFSIGVGLAAGLQGCSSSCGLQSIVHPFYLSGDPAFCGVPDYELICEGNKTILELNHARYVVTKISYENSTLHVVDEELESGNCSVPSRFPPVHWIDRLDRVYTMISSNPKFYPNYFFIHGNYFWSGWAIFLNCSMKIEDKRYHYIPCLSAKSSSVYVLSTDGEIDVQDLHPTCRSLSAVPTDLSGSLTDDEKNGTNIFQLLQQGFTIAWEDLNLTRFQAIQSCLREASWIVTSNINDMRSIFYWLLYPFQFGFEFSVCLQEEQQYTRFPNVIPFVVFICLEAAIILLAIALLIRCIVAPLAIYVFLASEGWKVMVPIDRIEKFLRNQQTLTPTRYVYTDIIAMTRHFNEKLGQGGFGSVYKGELPGGHLVAIKMLGESRCNGEDFINEVSTIGMIHHLNVVRLVGFCSEGSRRALVYEFMPNGSLDKYIFSKNGTHRRFTQEKLNEIALGVARGIDYLHRGCDMRILHFDIKPHNILLDLNFNPKVSDFGLARLYRKDHSLVSVSAARGTIGYIAPELVSRSFGVISYKSDVYSFGMLLLEMAGGRRNVDHRAENSSEVYYPSWIYDRLLQSGGPEICNSIEIDDMERKLCKVGLWCIQIRPADRPPMSRVIEMLEAELDTLQMPPKPFFSSSGPVSLRQSFVDSFPSDLSIISDDE